MSNSNNGLTKVEVSKRGYSSNEKWSFTEGDVRQTFEKIFSPEAEYVLFQTIANKEAVDALKGYCKSRKDFSDPWKITKITKKNDVEYVSGANDDCKGLYYGNSLRDVYFRLIDKVGKEILGENNYGHYSMVTTDYVHASDRDKHAIFWPEIFIVNAQKEKGLKNIIDTLSSEESFNLLQEIEAPQNYKMGEITHLYNLGIKPLIRLERELRLNSENLGLYIDFLSQMNQTYKWTGSVCHDD